jgi:hypothetical protein
MLLFVSHCTGRCKNILRSLRPWGSPISRHLLRPPSGLSLIQHLMAQEEKGGSRIGYWILFVLLVLAAAYIYFRR